jgi:hypothetical protein
MKSYHTWLVLIALLFSFATNICKSQHLFMGLLPVQGSNFGSLDQSFSNGSILKHNQNEFGFIELPNLHLAGLTTDDSLKLKRESIIQQASLLIKFAGDGILDKMDVSKPIFLELAARIQYKIGFFEIGAGPGLMYCPGNEYFMNMVVGLITLGNNFYIAEKRDASLYIFTIHEMEIYWNDLESDYSDSGSGAYYFTLGVGWKLGENKRTRFDIGIKRLYEGFFNDYYWSFGHIGLGFTL